MHVILRTLLTLLRARRRPALSPWEPGSLTLRALPTDVDLALHINNGQYFSLFDLGRYDLMARAGVWSRMRALGWTPVVQSEQITFRRAVTLMRRFTVHTRMLGFDERCLFFEQRVVVDGEICVRAQIATRLLGPDGPVSREEILAELAVLGHEPPEDVDVSEELRSWRAAAALPSTRRPAPHRW